MARISALLVGLALLLTGGNEASAFNGRSWVCPSSTWSAYYYVPMQVYYYPPVTLVPMQRGIYANPIPAGPSQTGEPPLSQPPMPPAKVSNELGAPVVVTARSQTAARRELVRVGFWNLSGRDVRLTIEGKTWMLPRDRAITLDVERSFAWQIDQRTQRVERIADAETTYEVVIRE